MHFSNRDPAARQRDAKDFPDFGGQKWSDKKESELILFLKRPNKTTDTKFNTENVHRCRKNFIRPLSARCEVLRSVLLKIHFF